MTYPIPGSLADDLFACEESAWRPRFGEPSLRSAWPVPDDPYMNPRDIVGQLGSWLLPDGLVVSPQVPPFHRTPTALRFDFARQCRGEPASVALAVLGEIASGIGLPLPDADPAYVIGDSTQPDGRWTLYLPGPEDLTVLKFHTEWLTQGVVATTIFAQRPPKPRRSEEIRLWRARVPWAGNGTMYYRDRVSAEKNDGTLQRPGEWSMRTIW